MSPRSVFAAFVAFARLALGGEPIVPPVVTPRPDAIKLACVGDSITAGTVLKNKAFTYPMQLQRMLGDGWNVRNFGVSGATMLESADKPYRKQKPFADALAFQPDVVVIKLGTNDSKPQNAAHPEHFAADCRALLAAFREANPKVKFFLCLPVPAFPGNFGITEDVLARVVRPPLRQVAAEEKIPLIDLHAALAQHLDLFPDRVHPNAEGSGHIAQAVFTAVTGKAAPALEKSE
jgi:lysophospholipase L1-like esterase